LSAAFFDVEFFFANVSAPKMISHFVG